jgi:hypothetical protein
VEESDQWPSDPSFRRSGGPISKHVKVLERTKIWSWVLTGTETKIDCAGEGQEQSARPDPVKLVYVKV